MEIVKTSPILGLMLVFWFYQRKDYRDFVEKVQEENSKREENYQNTIDKLTEKIDVIKNVQTDVKEIKNYIFKQ
jgi:predicted S18 family serine protease